jgi:biotin operon repressor
MQAAERIEHGGDLMVGLAHEIAMLLPAHRRLPGAAAWCRRLRSPTYVSFWRDQLRAVPALHVFGFTAHGPASDIGRALSELISNIGWKQAAIRFSGAPGRDLGARVLGPGETDTDAILCPAGTGATDCCATCALCWQSQRSISFKGTDAVSNHVSSEVCKRLLGSATRKALLSLMADKASDYGTGIWASKQTMADELEVSKQTVITTIKGLVADGLLLEVGHRRCATGYLVEYAIDLPSVRALPLVRAHARTGQGFDRSSCFTGQAG